jgi:hypothetical protein
MTEKKITELNENGELEVSRSNSCLKEYGTWQKNKDEF